MLDVPLIDSPRTTLAEIQKKVPTLEDPATDKELARIELRESPIYSNLLMSLDGDTTVSLDFQTGRRPVTSDRSFFVRFHRFFVPSVI